MDGSTEPRLALLELLLCIGDSTLKAAQTDDFPQIAPEADQGLRDFCADSGDDRRCPHQLERPCGLDKCSRNAGVHMTKSRDVQNHKVRLRLLHATARLVLATHGAARQSLYLGFPFLHITTSDHLWVRGIRYLQGCPSTWGKPNGMSLGATYPQHLVARRCYRP